RDCALIIYRNTAPLDKILQQIHDQKISGLIFSPGPGSPEEATLCLDLLKYAPEHLPLLGVCLGHQCLAHYYGSKVIHAKKIMHGMIDSINHNRSEIFENILTPMDVGRYHSLIVDEVIPPLKVIASANNEVMGVMHESLPRIGIQFHPE